MDGLGELPGVGEVRSLRLHPQHVAERRHCQRLRHGVGDPALHLVVALGSARRFGVPVDVEPQFLGACPGAGVAGSAREFQPHLNADGEAPALGCPRVDLLGHGLAVRAEPGGGLPGLRERIAGAVGHLPGAPVRRGQVVLDCLVNGAADATSIQPGVRLRVLPRRQGVKEMTVGTLDAGLRQAPQDRQVGRLVGRHVA